MPGPFEEYDPDIDRTLPIDLEVRRSMSSASYITKNIGAQPTSRIHYDLLVNKNPTASYKHSGLASLTGIHEPHQWETEFRESLLNQKSPITSNLLGIETYYPRSMYVKYPEGIEPSYAYQKMIVDPIERNYAILSGTSYPTPSIYPKTPLSLRKSPPIDPFKTRIKTPEEPLLGINLPREAFLWQAQQEELMKESGYTPLNISESTIKSEAIYRQQELLVSLASPEEVQLRKTMLGFTAKARGGPEGEYSTYISKVVGDKPISVGILRHPEALEAMAARGIKPRSYIKAEIPTQFAKLLAETEPTEELILSQAEILERAVRELGTETPLTAFNLSSLPAEGIAEQLSEALPIRKSISSHITSNIDISQYHKRFIEAAKQAAKVAPVGARQIGYQRLANVSKEELISLSSELATIRASGQSLSNLLTEAEVLASSQRIQEIDVELSKLQTALIDPTVVTHKKLLKEESVNLEHERSRLQKRISPGATTLEQSMIRGQIMPTYEGTLPEIIPTERFYKQKPFIKYIIPASVTGTQRAILPAPPNLTKAIQPTLTQIKKPKFSRTKADIQIQLSQIRDATDRASKQAIPIGVIGQPKPLTSIGSWIPTSEEYKGKYESFKSLQPNDIIFVRKSLHARPYAPFGDILEAGRGQTSEKAGYALSRNVGYIVEKASEKGLHLKSMEATMGGPVFLGGDPSTIKERLIAAEAIPISGREDLIRYANILSEIQQRTSISEADIYRRQLSRLIGSGGAEASIEEMFLNTQRALQGVSPELLEHVGAERTLKAIAGGAKLQDLMLNFREAADITEEAVGSATTHAASGAAEAAETVRPKPGKAIGMIEEAFMRMPRAARWGIGGLATAIVGAGLLSSSLQRGQRELKPDMIAPGPDMTPMPDGSYTPPASPSVGGTTRIMDETVPGKGGNAYKVRIQARDRGDVSPDQLHQLVGQSLSQVQMPTNVNITSQDHRKKIKETVEDEFFNLLNKR